MIIGEPDFRHLGKSQFSKLGGLLIVAFHMIFRDRAKYLTLVGGLAFCTLLISQQFGVFCGVMLLTASTLRNIGAEIWVMDRDGRQVNQVVPMRSIEVQRVRSVPGVGWAVPLIWTVTSARLPDGSTETFQLVGLDSASLAGRPGRMLEGRVEDLRMPNAVILDQVAIERFTQKGVKANLGSTLEINDREVRVVGFCHTDRSFLGYPYAFTAYETALDCIPPERKTLSYILAKASPGNSPEDVAATIGQLPGLRALTSRDFAWATMVWFFKNTGVPLSFAIVVAMGLFIGLSVTGLTFLMFVQDNLRHLAAMKAMGAGFRDLSLMLAFQALFVGLVGYGIGLGLTALFGAAVLPKGVPAFFLPWQAPLVVGVLVLVVCLSAAALGIARLARSETAMVFK